MKGRDRRQSGGSKGVELFLPAGIFRFLLRQHRTIHGTHLACIMFRQLAQKSSAIHKVLPAVFEQSDENSDCVICAPELCGVALSIK